MPRPGLPEISVSALKNEIQRRVAGLNKLLRLRDDIDRQIAGLRALAGRLGPMPAVAKPVKAASKSKLAPKVRVPRNRTTGKPAPRKTFGVTAEQFIIALLKDKPLTTSQIKDAWSKAGRGGAADSDLSRMTKVGKLKRQPLGGKLGSQYSTT